MKVTRRELVALVAAAAAAGAPAVAQDSPETVMQRNAELLDTYGVAIDIEPAFSFKA
jgi:hypothetical protein